MRGQPELRHARIVDQPALHHVPAQRALQAAEREDRDQRRRESGRQLPPQDKPGERQRKHRTDDAPEQPMRVFPPEYRLECVEAHSLVHLPVFGRCLVFDEGLVPLRRRKRRQRADDRLPFGNRQPRMGEPGHAADDDDREHQRTTDQQPDRHGSRRAAIRPHAMPRNRRASSIESRSWRDSTGGCRCRPRLRRPVSAHAQATAAERGRSLSSFCAAAKISCLDRRLTQARRASAHASARAGRSGIRRDWRRRDRARRTSRRRSRRRARRSPASSRRRAFALGPSVHRSRSPSSPEPECACRRTHAAATRANAGARANPAANTERAACPRLPSGSQQASAGRVPAARS